MGSQSRTPLNGFTFTFLSLQSLLPSSRRPFLCVTESPFQSPVGTRSLDFSSVQFSRSVVSDSLRPHELQHARPPCPSPTPRVHSDSCPLSQRCHPAISSSVNPFSSHLQSFPASVTFQMSWLFTSGGQCIGASASVLPMNNQG